MAVTAGIAAGMVAAPLITGLMGNSAAKKSAAAANAMRLQAQMNIDAAVRELEKLGVPTVEAQQIVLQKPELVGLLQTETLGPSAYEQVKAPNDLVSAQMQALEGLKNRSEEGLTPEDRLALSNIQDSLASQNQAQQKGILQSFAERGQGGAGQELAARLVAGQQSAQNANQSGMELAAQVAAAKRNALADYGSMATNLRTQDVSEQDRLAQARDVINSFNLNNRQDIAAKNLAARQEFANLGSATNNQQEMYNKGLVGQQYNQQLAKSQAIANARVQQASSLNTGAGQQLQAGQNTAQGLANIGSGISNALGAVGQWKYGQQNDSGYDSNQGGTGMSRSNSKMVP